MVGHGGSREADMQAGMRKTRDKEVSREGVERCTYHYFSLLLIIYLDYKSKRSIF